MEITYNAGIYSIQNLINHKKYVGYAVNLNNRKTSHWTALRNNKHKNTYLQAAWNKYGEDKFQFSIIEECEESKLEAREHHWASVLNVHNKECGYNIRPTHPTGNCRHAEETKKKISENRKGKKQSRESIEQMLATKRARGTNRHSEETKKKMSEKGKGRKHSEETKKKFRERVYTEEVRQNMSNARRGTKQSIETVKKRADALRGRKKPEGFGKKISEVKRGKPELTRAAVEKHRELSSIAIYQCTLEGQIIKEWKSANEAARILDMSCSCINSVCNNKNGRKQHRGYKWLFKNK